MRFAGMIQSIGSRREPVKELRLMRRLVRTLLVAGAMALVSAPMPARAEAFVVPWFGAAFSQGPDFRAAENKPSFGAALGTMGGGGIFGFDVDFGYTPRFLESSTLAE